MSTTRKSSRVRVPKIREDAATPQKKSKINTTIAVPQLPASTPAGVSHTTQPSLLSVLSMPSPVVDPLPLPIDILSLPLGVESGIVVEEVEVDSIAADDVAGDISNSTPVDITSGMSLVGEITNDAPADITSGGPGDITSRGPGDGNSSVLGEGIEDLTVEKVPTAIFKNPNFVHSSIGAAGSKKTRLWKNLKQIISSERSLPWQNTDVTYGSIEGPPSFKPAKKYSDLSGLEAAYRDPQTKLRFSSPEEFNRARALPSDLVTGYLNLRKASAPVP